MLWIIPCGDRNKPLWLAYSAVMLLPCSSVTTNSGIRIIIVLKLVEAQDFFFRLSTRIHPHRNSSCSIARACRKRCMNESKCETNLRL